MCVPLTAGGIEMHLTIINLAQRSESKSDSIQAQPKKMKKKNRNNQATCWGQRSISNAINEPVAFGPQAPANVLTISNYQMNSRVGYMFYTIFK